MKIIQRHEKAQLLYFHYDENNPIYVCDIGYHKTPPRHTYGPAIRPYYLLHLIYSGKGEIERNGVITPLSQGQAFLIQPDEITTYRADEKEPWEYYWISFFGSLSKTIVEKAINGLIFPFRRSGILAIKNALEEEKGDTVDALNTLFAVLASVKTLQAQEEDAIKTSLKYLENNYFHQINIEELASLFGYSRAHFTTIFTKEIGVPPYHYLTDIRIEKAKALLQSTSLSVEEVAYSVGFTSLVRFSELFKKWTGVSPTQFKKSI
jgi:AraC-like DNA-binding protein